MIKRGEVWWINFDPSIGSEIRKKRPAIIVSNNVSNKYLSRFQVVPLTTNTEKIYPGEALVTFDRKLCKAMSDQLTTVSEKRILDKGGEISSEDMQLVSEAVKLQLGLL